MEPQSLPGLLRQRASARPARVYIEEVDGASATYGQVVEQALNWAAGLEQLGVAPGSVVLSMLPTSITAITSWLGVAWLRAIETGVNLEFRGRMLRYLLENSGAEIALVHDRFIDRFLDIGASTRLRAVVVVGGSEQRVDGPWPVIAAGELLDGVEVKEHRDPDLQDVACMMYTSGTTGPSKGVLCPWGQLHATSPAEWSHRYGDDEAQYVPFPMNHVGGKVPPYLMAMHDGRVVVRERFSGRAFWDDVRRYRCTLTILAGSMQNFLWQQPAGPDDSDNPLRHVIMLPLLPEYEQFARRFGIEILTGYNMTEISTPLLFDGGVTDWRSCGRVRPGYPGYDVRVVDSHDRPLGPNQVGELVVRTSEPWTLNCGYFGRPEATAAAWRNGWFHTGDAFTYDTDGKFYFVDRLSDALRRRGENISSFEVESHVDEHPDVVESAAVAVPSPWGEDDVKAVIVARPGVDLDPADLVQFLIPRMPRFMVPRYVEVVDALPKTDATQRVRKVELRRDALNDRTWDREAAGIALPREQA
jgi:crotonobetaine/carnitine-CoA ligase